MVVDKWQECEDSTDRKDAGFVNLYQITNEFVKPWTRNTGNSIALLMNKDKPMKASVMISHAWGECMIEAMAAVLGRASTSQMSLDTGVWFCAFAQYQPGDLPGDCGPGVAEQLALDPFACVIGSLPRYGMLVIHTSRVELYSRLWCVYEVNVAQDKEVICSAAMSMRFVQDMVIKERSGKVEMLVNTNAAECYSDDDKKMIRDQIVNGCGFKALDEKISTFRETSWRLMRKVVHAFSEWSKSGGKRNDFESLGTIVKMVQQAVMWTGLQCLWQVMEEHSGKKDYKNDLLPPAELAVLESGLEADKAFRQCMIALDEQLGDEMDLPPFFDPTKEGGKYAEDHAELITNFRYGVPVYTGILEMGAGGNIMSAAMQELGDEPDPDESDWEEFRNKSIEKVFQKFDADGNGQISRTELKAVLQKLSPELSDDEVNLLFNVADKDNNGYLDYSEFISWIRFGEPSGNPEELDSNI
eukprot:TRINITY_DN9030_c2_g1_i1.p1 TRINITY_DN9030_c2_g1~~TRINITY_DN9030_c2_g1_i1.p1  ORF type:complete len:540 (+),score=90.09 TRINITY_DN9030_c2_g1_i1:208-1620(+)